MVWFNDCDKSPSPLGFLKKCWNFVKDDVVKFLQEFYKHGRLPKVTTTSFIALVPKADNLQCIEEFRPICLVGCLYHLISKLLAANLKLMIGKLVSSTQTTFIEGRKMLDNVLVLNEVLDYAKRKKKKKKCLVVRVEFEKAYDCVSWSFLRYVLNRMGFGQKWVSWMEATIFYSSMSILVNGSPTTDFMASRGFRQGDPLSHFLFLLVVKGLAGLMRIFFDFGSFKGFSFNEDIHFEMLKFADDTIPICDGLGPIYGTLNQC